MAARESRQTSDRRCLQCSGPHMQIPHLRSTVRGGLMAAASGKPDDLESVRVIVDALKPFHVEDQTRILRWAQEKLGLGGAPPSLAAPPTQVNLPSIDAAAPAMPTPSGARDIRSFLQEKMPSNDVQFATAVAYYYAFEAPPSLRKTELLPADLQDAARQASRARLHGPKDTLHNALKAGYLDKGSSRGGYRINTVGENLVAMAMPGGAAADTVRKPRRRRNTPAKSARRGKGRGRGA